MNNVSFNTEKTAEVIAYIASRVDIGKTKLMKLLYLIDFVSYERLGKSITGDTYANWNLGAVPETIFFNLEAILSGKVITTVEVRGDNRYTKFSTTSAEVPTKLNSEERAILDEIILQYGNKMQGELVEMVHNELPWKFTKHGEEIPYFLAPYRNYKKMTAEELTVLHRDSAYMEKIDSALEEYKGEYYRDSIAA